MALKLQKTGAVKKNLVPYICMCGDLYHTWTNSGISGSSSFLGRGTRIRRQTTNSEITSNKINGQGLPSSALPLGHPLPLDEHACSVSLPTWCSVVGYEEGSPQVTEKLACGYPRFVYHPYIIKLMDVSLQIDKKLQSKMENRNHMADETENSSVTHGQNEWDCIVLPSRDSALRCHDFLVKACGYLDGRAASPRLKGTSNNMSQIVGSERIELFSSDNAIDQNFDDVANSGDDDNCLYKVTSPIRILNLQAAGVYAVIFPAQTAFAIEAKSYWQHTGEVLSSRRAEIALTQMKNHRDNNAKEDNLPRVTSSFHDGKYECDDSKDGWKFCPHTNQFHLTLYPSGSDSRSKDINSGKNPYESIKNRIASIVGTPISHIFLTASGMASIYAALRSARRRAICTLDEPGGGTSIVFGFPYLDTLKMCSRPEIVPDGVLFFGHGNEKDLSNLKKMLNDRKNDKESPRISVLITEFPSNPLLNCPNLQNLRTLADEYDFAIVVDDTIGNFANVDLIQSGLADVVCTSLTKLFNGRGDAMAGSVVTNPNTKIGQWLQQDLQSHHHDYEGLWVGDANAINSNSEDFLARSSQINETTEELADWLIERDEVAAIYYPKFRCPDGYNSVMNKSTYGGEHKPGYGGLLSILLNSHICQRTFYDKLDLSKGPSLGTNFSLVCPYTLLAHYHELDFAMSYDVQPNLLRFAIGLEDVEILKEKFTKAFQESKLHPKLPLTRHTHHNNMIKRGYCTFSHLHQYGSIVHSDIYPYNHSFSRRTLFSSSYTCSKLH